MPIGRLISRTLTALLVGTAVVTLLAAPVRAQYGSVPDCMIAGLNAITNEDSNYFAGRDESYKQFAREWAAYTASLTPEQLKGYSEYACAHLLVEDQGKDADQVWHWHVNYPSIDEYFAAVGGHPGQTTTTTSTTPNAPGQQTSPTTPTAPSTFSVEPVLFHADFSDLPEGLDVRDENDQPIEAQLVSEKGDQFLRIESDQLRSIYLPSGKDWTNYSVEARVRIKNASLGLYTRMADDHCAAYGIRFAPVLNKAELHTIDASCVDQLVDTVSDVSLKGNRWLDLRLDIIGNQLTVTVNDTSVLTAQNDILEHGFPALRLMPSSGRPAVLDLDSLHVVQHRSVPAALEKYAAAPGVVVAELQQLGLVPDGGQLVFSEPLAYFNGSGNFFQPLAESAPRTDIVMGGSITFTSGAPHEDENCGLDARIITKGNLAAQETQVVFDNDGYLNVFEFDNPDRPYGNAYYNSSRKFPPGQTYHLLFTMIGPQLVVFVNGERMLVVNNLKERAGSYGISLLSESPSSKCRGEKVWVYSFR